MIKKSYFRLFATGLLPVVAFMVINCNNDELETTAQSSNKEITFRALGDRPVLRAATTGINEITNFTLQGIWQNDAALPADKRLFDAIVVTRSENGSSWDYSPKKTWPEGSDGVLFYAYSPANSRNMTKGFKGQDNNPRLEYTVPRSANSQEDLLVAVTERLTSGTVSLNFKHALSRVLVRARTTVSGTSVKIDNVTFKNLYTSGKWALEADVAGHSDGLPAAFTPNTAAAVSVGVPTAVGGFNYASYPSAKPAGAEQPAYLNYCSSGFQHFWDVTESGKDSYEVDLSQSAVADDSGYKLITGSLGGMMVMPQETTCDWDGSSGNPGVNDFYIEVTYRPNGGSAIVRNIKVPDLWKKPNGSFCFEPGKQYTFDLTVDGATNGIELQVNDVADWNEEGFVPQSTVYFTPLIHDGNKGSFTVYLSDPNEENPDGYAYLKMNGDLWQELESMYNTWELSTTQESTKHTELWDWVATQLNLSGLPEQNFFAERTSFKIETAGINYLLSALVSKLNLGSATIGGTGVDDGLRTEEKRYTPPIKPVSLGDLESFISQTILPGSTGDYYTKWNWRSMTSVDGLPWYYDGTELLIDYAIGVMEPKTYTSFSYGTFDEFRTELGDECWVFFAF